MVWESRLRLAAESLFECLEQVQEEGGLEGVGDIRFAGEPGLALVALFGEVVGFLDRAGHLLGKVAGNLFYKDIGVGGGYHGSSTPVDMIGPP